MQRRDYFHPETIQTRINRRYRRQAALRLHLILTVLLTVFGLAVYSYLATRLYYSGVLFLLAETALVGLFAAHVVWKRSRDHAETEIDAQMREARHYQRGDVFEHDAVYRLSADGELFYDEDEIEYDLRGKRKRES